MKAIGRYAIRKKCLFCGGLVLDDPEQQAIHHEDPVCPAWLDKVRALGGKVSLTVVEVPDEKLD